MLFLALSLTLVMAVDRSKFRTCSQTSFCRRHRFGRSQPQYQYQLLPESIQFHPEGQNSDQNEGKEEETASLLKEEEISDESTSRRILESLKRTLLLSKTQEVDGTEDNAGPLDPFVRGPGPFFTAKLVNKSPVPSTGKLDESLLLSIYLLQDGVARLRITEEYSKSGANGSDENNAFGKARWTCDDLILNWKEMETSNNIEVIDSTSGEEMKLFPLLFQQLSIDEGNVSMDNFVAFRYGKSNEESQSPSSLVLVQFQPFALHFFSGNLSLLLSFNTDSLMHFEIRRHRERGDLERENSDNIQQDPEDLVHNDDDYSFDKEIVDDVSSKDNHDPKEVVGYWEDGLAIYADGTREERVMSTPNDDVPPQEEITQTDRKLLQTRQQFEPDTEGMWEESFGDHIDSKPYGPMSVGADIVFPKSTHLFGLPEHASGTQLKMTNGEGAHYREPYRLYNLDVFEYELDETMALYGEVPLIVSQSQKGETTGVFWFNPTETFVDIESTHEGHGTKTHWMSESGVIDLFILPGPKPNALYEQYARLTGRIPLPPMFALGYHQCRWNYRDQDDIYQVHDKFEELDYPYDVLWLDIEHTDGKRYFTWDKSLFPTPTEMQEKLISQGRHMVTIVDPHIKRDNNYYIHKEATSKGLYIKDKEGKKDYDGWCWPGSSSYLDFTNERVRNWWADQFSFERYVGSTPSLFTWNDMNEPSVFNGPEVSMQKDLRNLDGIEHREWHNLFGILFQKATSEGLIRRNAGENERPFVLSRSFFAGSQKYGAIWTGDNEASWSHLKIATPMLLSLNVAALSFVGADVGGFFGNPDAELMTRWMQAGAYQPFFRAHAHLHTKRREPWLFGDEWMTRMRKAAMARYALLPYWYTVFRKAGTSGMPVMRTMWMQYPALVNLYSLDDQYLIGADLLVKPVTDAGVTETRVIFPTEDTWYDVDTMKKIPLENSVDNNSHAIIVNSDIDKIPVFQRGGSIICRKLRLRRSTRMMERDPYTLYIALDSSQKANGELYMDDEHSFDYDRKGNYGLSKISVDWKSFIRSDVSNESEWINENVVNNRMVERIVVMGVEESPKKVTLQSAPLHFNFDSETNSLVIRKPLVSALSSWEIAVVS